MGPEADVAGAQLGIKARSDYLLSHLLTGVLP